MAPQKIKNHRRFSNPKDEGSTDSADSSIHSSSTSNASSIPVPAPAKMTEDDNFSWRDFLVLNPYHEIVPVPISSFLHAPIRQFWKQISIPEVKVEYRVGAVVVQPHEGSNEEKVYENVFWIGTIKNYFGYMVKVESEGYPIPMDEIEEAQDLTPTKWMNYLKDCFRIGTCASIAGAALIPPLELIQTDKDWRDTVLRRISGHISIHPEIRKLVGPSLSAPFSLDAWYEVLDQKCISRMKLAQLKEIKGGRLRLVYWDATPDTASFWCHFESGLIREKGWCKTIGHEISGPENYNPLPLDIALIANEKPQVNVEIEVGMMLEAIDPLDTGFIAAAQVVKKLECGYMLITLKSDPDGDQQDINILPSNSNQDNWENEEVEEVKKNYGDSRFLVHVTDRTIFYCGFCEKMGIEMTPPKEYRDQNLPFNWNEYFIQTGTKKMDLANARHYEMTHSHGFALDRKLEATDLFNRNLICLATVTDVKGRLIKIHFDGWGNDYDQWMDIESPDLFPIGYCDMTSIKLSGPKKDAPFWKKYVHPDNDDSVRKNALKRWRQRKVIISAEHIVTPTSSPNKKSTKKPVKRKAAEPLLPEESQIFNNAVFKAEAVKLGSKPKVLRTMSIREMKEKGLLASLASDD